MFMLYLFILAVFHGANTQDRCVPDPIQGLQLEAEGILRWQEVTNCEIYDYQVLIYDKDDAETMALTVVAPYIYISWLEACEDYRFIISAISLVGLMGEPTILETRLPAFPDANVTVAAMRAEPRPNNGFLLEWDIEKKWEHCVEYFRVVRWDRLNEPFDTYVTDPFILVEDLTPCAIYEFTVVPIYNNDMEGGIGIVPFSTPHQVSAFPTLESVRPGPTFLDLILDLPPYVTNRCPISSVVVDGSPFVNLTIPIDDSPARPPVHVHIESLRLDTMYLFHITVINNAGASVPLPIAIQTLPATE